MAEPTLAVIAQGILGLLAEAAEEQPLVCLVDDAQWLDRASARTLASWLAVCWRRDRAGVRDARAGRRARGSTGAPCCPVGRRDARALLESVLTARLDERVLERIVAEARGNPLALRKLWRGLSPAQLAGGFGLPAAAPVSAGIEEGCTRRLAALPSDAGRLLLLAAADPVGDPALVWRAAERLGTGVGCADRRIRAVVGADPSSGISPSADSFGGLHGRHA